MEEGSGWCVVPSRPVRIYEGGIRTRNKLLTTNDSDEEESITIYVTGSQQTCTNTDQERGMHEQSRDCSRPTTAAFVTTLAPFTLKGQG